MTLNSDLENIFPGRKKALTTFLVNTNGITNWDTLNGRIFDDAGDIFYDAVRNLNLEISTVGKFVFNELEEFGKIMNSNSYLDEAMGYPGRSFNSFKNNTLPKYYKNMMDNCPYEDPQMRYLYFVWGITQLKVNNSVYRKALQKALNQELKREKIV